MGEKTLPQTPRFYSTKAAYNPKASPRVLGPASHLTELPFHLLGPVSHVNSGKDPLTELCGSQREEKGPSA